MYNDLDPLLHSQLRLAIISMLVASGKVEFTHIQSETKAAAGNISIQIKKLEDASILKLKNPLKTITRTRCCQSQIKE